MSRVEVFGIQLLGQLGLQILLTKSFCGKILAV